jgi:hypothetical protein
VKKSTLVHGSFLGVVFLCGVALLAQAPPKRDVGPGKHPNLAAAQRLCDEAFMRITDAQKANEFDLGGHAAKAKELLDQASREIKLAAVAANR